MNFAPFVPNGKFGYNTNDSNLQFIREEKLTVTWALSNHGSQSLMLTLKEQAFTIFLYFGGRCWTSSIVGYSYR